MEVVNNYGLFTKNTIRLYILQSTLYLKEAIFKYNRIAIGLQSDYNRIHFQRIRAMIKI